MDHELLKNFISKASRYGAFKNWLERPCSDGFNTTGSWESTLDQSKQRADQHFKALFAGDVNTGEADSLRFHPLTHANTVVPRGGNIGSVTSRQCYIERCASVVIFMLLAVCLVNLASDLFKLVSRWMRFRAFHAVFFFSHYPLLVRETKWYIMSDHLWEAAISKKPISSE